MDDSAHESFDRLTRLASRFLNAPLALVNLVDDRAQRSVSCVAPAEWPMERQAALEDSFCRHAVLEREPVLIEDATADPRVRSSRFVVEQGVRSYLGIPLIVGGGAAVGTLCVSDLRPRHWTAEEVETMRDLAASAVTEIELRLETARQRRVEEALRESELRFRTFVDSVQDYAITMLDPEGGVLGWSRGGERIKGYTREEITGRHFSIFFPEGDGPQRRAEELAMTALVGGHAEEEGWVVCKDGSRFWGSSGLTALRRGDGDLIGYALITRDLTERRRVEEALREAHAELEAKVAARTAELARSNEELRAALTSLRRSEERFRLVLASITDFGIVMLDPEGRILAWNTGAERLTGYSSEEAIGRHVSLTCLPEQVQRGEPDDELHEARDSGRAVREDWRRRKDGSLYWDFEITTRIESEGEFVGFVKVTRDLTEHREMERALERERVFLAAVLESLAEGIVACDAEGNLILFNRATRELHGLPPEPIPFDRHPQHYGLFRPDATTRLGPEEIPLLRALHGEVVRDAEMVIAPADGRPPRHVVASGQAVYSASGEKLGAVVAMRDITDHRAAAERERELIREQAGRAEAEEARRRLQTVLESIADPFIVIDPEQRFAFLNASAEQLFGRSKEELIGARLLDLFPSLADTQQYRAILRAMETGQPQEVDALSGIRPDRWFHCRVYPLDGGAAFYAKDITERRRAEQELRESEERFRQLADGAREVFWMLDPEYTQALYVSPVYERVFGRSSETFRRDPRTCLQSVVPEYRDRMLDFMLSLRDGARSEVVQIERPDGERRWVRVQGFPVHDTRGRVYRIAGTTDDITEERRSEAALREAKEEAERANRAKSEFLSRMSHELRTPMNAILGFAQVLEMDLDRNEDRESIEQILSAGRHLLSLIDEVLDLSKIEAGRIHLAMEPVPVRRLLEESAQLVRTLARERSISVEVDCAAERLAHADPQRLRQVLLNLLSNAIKYNHDGGSVRVTCREKGEGGVLIQVRDTGPGISPENLERLFRPFERLDAERRQVEGTGLGLALSRGLVQAMGGEIGVESVVGEGTTFWVELPLAEDGAEAPAASGPDPDRSGSAPYRVLYIEDNVANLRLIERILERRPDIDLSAAMQGSLGLELARELAPDLILLDVQLPDVPGEVLMQRLQADPTLREIPVVVISADATRQQKERLLAAGARAYLVKPIDVHLLLDTMEEHLPTRGAGRI